MQDDETPSAAAQSWIDTIDRSLADRAASDTVSVAFIMRELNKSIARMEAKLAARTDREPSSTR